MSDRLTVHVTAESLSEGALDRARAEARRYFGERASKIVETRGEGQAGSRGFFTLAVTFEGDDGTIAWWKAAGAQPRCAAEGADLAVCDLVEAHGVDVHFDSVTNTSWPVDQCKTASGGGWRCQKRAGHSGSHVNRDAMRGSELVW